MYNGKRQSTKTFFLYGIILFTVNIDYKGTRLLVLFKTCCTAVDLDAIWSAKIKSDLAKSDTDVKPAFTENEKSIFFAKNVSKTQSTSTINIR